MSAVIVLQPGARASALAALAEARGWRFVGDAERTHQSFARQVWRDGQERELLFQHDHRMEVLAVEVMGWDAEALAAELREVLPVRSAEALHAQAGREDAVEALGALRALAWVEWRAPAAATLAAAERLLRHEREAARRAALRAALAGGWFALAPLLRSLAEADEAMAEALLWCAEQLEAQAEAAAKG
ncbi:MAG: hypothetical protein H6740_07970 [Alphaproteobacteria bacterium]|nr:hypothetical protein [Alphaproteobacteria bacterium]